MMQDSVPRSDFEITLVVAMANDRVIGHENRMPWHLPEDLKHFKATTFGHCMIMGRKTFDSIGRPLPGRKTVVVTRDGGWGHTGVTVAHSLEEAIEFAKQESKATASNSIFIVGGSQIYQQALELADKVIATEIDLIVEGDAFFPVLEQAAWDVVDAEEHLSQAGLKYRIRRYQRIKKDPACLNIQVQTTSH